MKSFLRFLLAALTLGLAFLPLLSRGAGPTPEIRVGRLDALVTLTSAQKAKAVGVFQQEDADLLALPPAERGMKTFEVRQASRDRIRALLTPAQQRIYDRAPQMRGGGLTLPTPETKLANLDATVSLTAAQKPVAMQVFQEEFDALLSLAPGDRLQLGMPIRQAAKDQVRALLTPEQLNKMENVREAAAAQESAELTAVENLLRASKTLAARLGPIVSLSSGGTSTISTSSDGSRKGTYTIRAVGATSAEALVVAWEKVPATGEIRIVRLELSGGATIQP